MLSEIIISQDEVEQITGLDISETQVSGVYRFKTFGNFSNLVAVVIGESILFGVITVFVLPVVAIALSRSAKIEMVYLLSIGILISLFIYSFRWIYLYFKKQEFRNTIVLLEQIDKHNQVIQSLSVIQQLSDLKISDSWLECNPNMIECLNTNRESLVCALMMDAIARKNRLSTLQRVELLATIENNLEFIRCMSDRNPADEYTHLIAEVLTINLKVTEEMKNINSF